MKLLSKFDKSQNVKVSCIYKIKNTKNNKVYIGQTTNFRKRFSDYKNIHKKDNLTQPVAVAIKKHGTENFTIEMVEFCNPENLTEMEDKWIKKYNSCNHKYGYNVTPGLKSTNNTKDSRLAKSIGHMGLKESASTKRKKSNMIIAIKDNKILVCDSGKLFGDFVGKSKDMVKNCLRQPSKIKGYRVYYDDYNKRQDIRKKMYKKRCIRDSEYMEILDLLDKIEIEGVETIYEYFDSVDYLKYTDDEYEIVPYQIIIAERIEDYDNIFDMY